MTFHESEEAFERRASIRQRNPYLSGSINYSTRQTTFLRARWTERA